MSWSQPIRVRRQRVVPWRVVVVLGTLLLAVILCAAPSVAQTCSDCVRYAGTELNLRQDPSLEVPVLRFIPRGAAVERTPGVERNGYAPVRYEGVSGWAVALGLVATRAEVDAFVVPGSAPAPTAAPPPAASAETRVTLAPLDLRSGPASEAEPILTMPEGAVLTLTREGAENGYVTVSFGGETGWAYADILGEVAVAS